MDLFVSPSKIDDKNKWSQWTKAMRYFLIDIKHILTISLLSDPYIWLLYLSAIKIIMQQYPYKQTSPEDIKRGLEKIKQTQLEVLR